MRLFSQGAKRAWVAYEEALSKRPATTKAFVSAVMFATTDVAVQYGEFRNAASGADSSAFLWQPHRTATQAAFGAYYGTVHAHYIWGQLERLFVTVLPARGIALTGLPGAAARVAVDQCITGTPLFNVVFFYVTGRFTLRLSHSDAIANVEARLGPMLQRHWSFWVPFHTINFWLVPFRHRLLPAQGALFGWSAFMSYTGSSKDQ
jgi:hypothetical protein